MTFLLLIESPSAAKVSAVHAGDLYVIVRLGTELGIDLGQQRRFCWLVKAIEAANDIFRQPNSDQIGTEQRRRA